MIREWVLTGLRIWKILNLEAFGLECHARFGLRQRIRILTESWRTSEGRELPLLTRLFREAALSWGRWLEHLRIDTKPQPCGFLFFVYGLEKGGCGFVFGGDAFLLDFGDSGWWLQPRDEPFRGLWLDVEIGCDLGIWNVHFGSSCGVARLESAARLSKLWRMSPIALASLIL